MPGRAGVRSRRRETMTQQVRVTREYQTGGRSIVHVRDGQELADLIAEDAATRRDGQDMQSVRYVVATLQDALSLGAIDAGWGWVLPDSKLTIHVAEGE
jgi:hypothetical protein